MAGNCIISHGGDNDKLKPKAFYYYGDPNNLGAEARTYMGYNGKVYWLAQAPDRTAVPVYKSIGGGGIGNVGKQAYTGTIYGPCQPAGGWKGVISQKEGPSGTITRSTPACAAEPEKEWTVVAETYNDEDTSGSYGSIRLKIDNVWYTPAEAVAAKAIKPMVLIGNKYWSGGGGSVSTLYNGGRTSSGCDYESGLTFAIMTNKKFTLQAVQYYSSYNEHDWFGYCETDNGRFTSNNTVYTKSQYKEKYW